MAPKLYYPDQASSESEEKQHTTSILRRDPMRAITRPRMRNTTQNHMLYIHKKPGKKNEDA